MEKNQKMKYHSRDSPFQSRATAANFLLHTPLTATSKVTPTPHERVTPTSHHPSQQLPPKILAVHSPYLLHLNKKVKSSP